MGIDRYFVRDVTILRAPLAENRYHDQQPDWANATETATKGWLSQTLAQEILDGRDAKITGQVLFLPDETDIVATDRVVIDASTYDVEGVPQNAYTPRGPHHLEVQLRAVEG